MADGERMSPVDRAWLLMERPTNQMMIVGVIVLGGRLKRVQLRQFIDERMMIYDRFRCHPVSGTLAAHWVRTEQFALDDHVLGAALPASAGQHELEALVSELASTPFNTQRPWWTFHLVERYGRGSAIIVRVHHCYADGIAMMRVVLGLADGESPAQGDADNARDAPVSSLLSDVVHQGVELVEQGARFVLHPGEAVGAVADTASALAELARMAVLPDDPPTPLKGPLSGSRRVAWAAPLPFDEVRAISHALGCTVNDVLMATLAGALRRYLRTRRRSCRDLTLHAAVPVNLRSAHEALATLGNHFGMVFVELPVGIADPRRRLRRVHESMNRLKASPQALLTYGLLAAVGSFPEAVENAAIDVLTAKVSLVASNVPGPRKRIRIGGIPVRQLLFWVPQAGSIGVGVSLLSYDHQLQFGVIADQGLVPDPSALAAMFVTEFERLVLKTRPSG